MKYWSAEGSPNVIGARARLRLQTACDRALDVLAHVRVGIELLANYFFGYTVSWLGACIGAWWGFVTGFVAGWFFAFVRNFSTATWLLVVRVKAELFEVRDFLDHI